MNWLSDTHIEAQYRMKNIKPLFFIGTPLSYPLLAKPGTGGAGFCLSVATGSVLREYIGGGSIFNCVFDCVSVSSGEVSLKRGDRKENKRKGGV